jgi:GT2 family glycosyltransferase
MPVIPAPLRPAKVVDVELTTPLSDWTGLGDYRHLRALVRMHGIPVGWVQLPVLRDRVRARDLGEAILRLHSRRIGELLTENALAAPHPDGLRPETFWELPPPPSLVPDTDCPPLTVAVCTRDRPEDLALCLEALAKLDYPKLEILVIDNAPATDATAELVRSRFPGVRHVLEPRPGLDWARNRAVLEATGEILAYADDDVVVDPGWARGLANAFAECPSAGCVTGLVVPYELETEAQQLFERYGGFGRGFQRKEFRVAPGSPMPWGWIGTGQFGTGANMAFRRATLLRLGGFDPALDVGTATNGGGDLEMYFRVLRAGEALVYEPRALVRHRHRRDMAKLQSQIANNGIGFSAYLARTAAAFPREISGILRLSWWWYTRWFLARLGAARLFPRQLPADLIGREFLGSFAGVGRYRRAKRTAATIADRFGGHVFPEPPAPAPARPAPAQGDAVAVRSLDLSQPVTGLPDCTGYGAVNLFLTWRSRPMGKIPLDLRHGVPGPRQLRETLARHVGHLLADPVSLWEALRDHLAPASEPTLMPPALAPLPDDVPVSVVVATFDRPDDLRVCLEGLTRQATRRAVEILVVDNHPASGLTPPVVADFPGVILIRETRQGLSYARNAGFLACTGEIAVATDDDVVIPPDWLETLVAPFARNDVMAVTGNVLPWELETRSQQCFENYGGLGRGFDRREFDWTWFEGYKTWAVPTWDIGATANAAFRTCIFRDPRIGLLEETLGAGMPTGCSEDTLLFYRVLKAGHVIVYEGAASLWHKHRRNMESLRRQIHNYSKGHVAYHLLTWLQDGDWRALFFLLYRLPSTQCRRFFRALTGRGDYPLSLVWLEIRGNLAGPWSLVQAWAKVRRLGRSGPGPSAPSELEPQGLFGSPRTPTP